MSTPYEVYNPKLVDIQPIVCASEASANVVCARLREQCGKFFGASCGWEVRPSNSTLPVSLSPFHTNHPASSAYRITMSPHEWTWTQDEQIEMAKALVQLDGMRQPKMNDPALTCESCQHMRPRTPKDRKHEAGYDLAHHWCAKNDQPTLPGALRCGGDDYERRTN